MSKSDKVWQAITAVTFAFIGVIIVILFIRILSASLEIRTQQKAQESRITAVEQNIQTIKQSLDAKGFTDLNF